MTASLTNISDPTLLAGPLLLGHLFNTFLYGVELVQFYRYTECFPEDKQWTRRLVYSVVTLDSLQTIFAFYGAWQILGSGWGHPVELSNPEWPWGAVPLFTGIVSLLVQVFYAHRISRLIKTRKTKYLVGFIIFIATAQAVCGVFSGVYYSLGSLTESNRIIAAVTTAWLGGSALCDLVISATIVTYLCVQLSGFSTTHNVVQKVITMTIETGAITTSTASVDLILFLMFPKNNLHLIFCIPLAKLYSNTLLAMLNARKGSFRASTGPTADPILPITADKEQTPNSFSFKEAHYRGQSSTTLPLTPGTAKYASVDIHGTSPVQFRQYAPPTPLAPAPAKSQKSVRTVPPLRLQPALSSSGSSHTRTGSTQRYADSSPSAYGSSPSSNGSRGWRKHQDTPSIAYTINDIPSHLDMLDSPFRTRFLNKF